MMVGSVEVERLSILAVAVQEEVEKFFLLLLGTLETLVLLVVFEVTVDLVVCSATAAILVVLYLSPVRVVTLRRRSLSLCCSRGSLRIVL
eukprot:4746561-Amphidinium_carterae.1